jgi:hypothetical protein
MKKSALIVLIILALALAACGVKYATAPMAVQNEAPRSPDAMGIGGGAADESMGYTAAMPTQAAYDAAKPGTASTDAVQERLVIMNADLSIVVPDPQAKLEAISQMADNLGGFVVSMNMYQTYTNNGGTAPEGSISIRVPQDKLDTALNQIKADAIEVRNENRSGQDVTAAYVDLQSQLNNLELAETDLQAIMDEAKNSTGNDITTKTQDVLMVHTQIVNIRGQIEQIKGQMQYYENSSAYSLINVTLIAEETVQPIQIGTWTPSREFNEAVEDLVTFLQGFVDFLIRFFVNIVPALIVIFGPIALIVWAVLAGVKRRKSRKANAG